MNWLAHAFLSPADIQVRLGNFLADLVKGRDRLAMSASFLHGVRQHQVIDAFTDAHPIVRRSRARIRGGYAHVTGILVDVFYDHFLARDWARYADEPLEIFTNRLYADLQTHRLALPAGAQFVVERMIAEDRLGSYRTLAGIEQTLGQMSLRLSARRGRKLELHTAIDALAANIEGLGDDFAEFFPLLRAHADKAANTGQ